ncbi:MAG: hypothetical protein IKL33_04135 [Alphaproteobacteria bacterium]|nr:hypothetical protein [Alphaproteobacteria bacterium]
MMKKFLFFILLALSLNISKSMASAPQVLGEYGDWVAYYYRDNAGAVCYMASTPKKDEGKYTKRGDIYAVITHRPNENSFNVVNFNAGYNFKKDTKVEVKIGAKTFDKLFTSGDKAWTTNEKTDKEMVEAMKRGSRMVVHGTSSKGTKTKDTYSLNGFSNAYRAISNKCKAK